jgi:SAM-dependent methyltransferase
MTDEVAIARRRLGAVHDELRNAGLNPIEALTEVAATLTGRLKVEGNSRLPASAIGRLLVLRDVVVDGALLANLYQEFLLSEARNGLGQYLTPLPVADFVADVASRSVDEGMAVDPFCGSGLLLDCLGQRAPELKLIGIEINEPVAALAEALSELTARSIDVRNTDAFAGLADGTLPEADVVVTNPPFGATVTTADITSLRFSGVPESLLALGKWPAELLGLEVCLRILRPGGVLVAVLPQSVITNTRWDGYRRDLFSRLSVKHVVSLPEATFMPFRGVAKACVIVGAHEPSSLPYRCSFYRSQSVGYTDAGRVSSPCDLPTIVEQIAAGAVPERAEAGVDGAVRIEASTAKRSGRGHRRLGDVAEIIRGKNPPSSHYMSEGPILLKVGDLAGSLVSWRSRERNHVPTIWFDKQRALHLRPGDICLTAAAHRPRYIGLKVDLLDEVPECGAMPSGEVMVIRLRGDSGIDPAALLFYLRGSDGYGQIQEIVRGSTGHLYPKDLAELRLPPFDAEAAAETAHLFREAADHFRKYLAREHAAATAAGWAAVSSVDNG